MGKHKLPMGEFVPIVAAICGEMAAQEVPLNPAIDVDALKAGDGDPLEVVVAVPATKSKRGWNYKPAALKDIVQTVMTQGLPGFLGHQKPENVDHEFPTPVTHWCGAKYDEAAPVKDKNGKQVGQGVAYFRGVVDQSAGDLKRWIRGKAVKTVSIFGVPKLAKAAGETDVVGYAGLSIDWTPLGRAGMPTSIVALGEMADGDFESDDLTGEMDGSFEELRDELREAVKVKLGGTGYTYVRRTFPEHVIAEYEPGNTETPGTRLYSIPYGIVDGQVQLGDPTEVVEQRTYVPAKSGEIKAGGDTEVKWTELIAQIKAAVTAGECTLDQVAGEMGLPKPTDAQTLDKVRVALGVSGEMDVLQVAGDARKALDDQEKATLEKLVNKVVSAKVTGEMAQGLVRQMLHVADNATEEQISGEVDRLLGEQSVKDALSKLHLDQPAGVAGTASEAPQSLRTKRVSV